MYPQSVISKTDANFAMLTDDPVMDILDRLYATSPDFFFWMTDVNHDSAVAVGEFGGMAYDYELTSILQLINFFGLALCSHNDLRVPTIDRADFNVHLIKPFNTDFHGNMLARYINWAESPEFAEEFYKRLNRLTDRSKCRTMVIMRLIAESYANVWAI